MAPTTSAKITSTGAHTSRGHVVTIRILVADDQELVRAGFAAVLGTQSDFDAAVRTVAAGDALLAPSVTRRLIERRLRLETPPARLTALLARLSEREREVLAHIARGLSNVEIAARMYL